MIKTFNRKLGPWIPHVSTRASFRRAFVERRTLPPGRILNFGRAILRNRMILIEEAERHGPVFKIIWNRRLCTCIVGLETCKRFLKEHAESIAVATADLSELIPKGFLRGMEGDLHRTYRDQLVRATDRSVVDENRSELEPAIQSRLARFAVEGPAADHPPVVMAQTLSSIGRAMLIRIFFGAGEGSEVFERLDANYAEMGPDLFVWNPGEPQARAFGSIRSVLRESEPAGDCILLRMQREGIDVDATMLGNLIYMVEIGRFDLYSLFRWILKFAAEHPDDCKRSAAVDAYAGAFISETLRLEQAERLMRNVNRDIEFDGFFIPKGSKVRLCTWESHKSTDHFPDPFAFKPDRFLHRTYSTDQYAPFGLGAHHCPMWAVTKAASELFLQVVARTYEVEPHGDGPAFRNQFHWQPAKTFWVSLR